MPASLQMRCAFFSLRWPILRSAGSGCTSFRNLRSRGPEHKLSRCGTHTQLLRGVRDHRELCLLHWQADSSPLGHQQSPPNDSFKGRLFCLQNLSMLNMTWTLGGTSRPNQLPSVISYKFSVHFSHSVVSDSLRPHGLQHARLPCPSPTPRVYPNPCPLSRWCHPTISSSSRKWVSSLHQVAKVLEFQLQHQSFQWIFRTDFL